MLNSAFLHDAIYSLTTLQFRYAYAFLLPLAALLALILRGRRRFGVVFPSTVPLTAAPATVRVVLRRTVLPLLGGIAVIALTTAAARPQSVETLRQQRESRNIMLAIDISRSMEAPDFDTGYRRVPRVAAVKSVVSDFIQARTDDRLGLVVFGNEAFLQCPLTLDHSVLTNFVRRLEVGMAGDGTAIGDGLGLAIKRMLDLPGKSKAVVLLTDGVSNSGQVHPLQAARIAEELGIKVHTIGIGTREGVIARRPGDIFTGRTVQRAEFDEKTLREIAERTGGVYFHAEDLEGLQRVYAEIDQLERSETEDPERTVSRELFAPFAAAGLLAYALYLLLANSILMRVP